MSLLREMFGGQHRITPDRELEPKYTGKTIFTSQAPVPLLHRIAVVIFCAGFIAVIWVFADRLQADLQSYSDKVLLILLWLSVAFCFFILVMAISGLGPFHSNKRTTKRRRRRR